MLFVVQFEDNAAKTDVRPKLAPHHFAFLERNAAVIKAAGPLKEDGSAAGAMWLVEAADAAAVKALYESDPFWSAGLRQSVRVLEWKQVFAEGERLA
jgi:uncharacterized protein